MKIVVDNGLKKKVQVENRKNRRGIHNLWLFEKVLLAVFIAFIVIFPIYCWKTGYLVSTITRTGEKSYFIVAMITSCIAGMGMTLVLLVSVLRKRIENVIIGERVDETIEIIDDKLFYTFRIKTMIISKSLDFTGSFAGRQAEFTTNLLRLRKEP